MIDYSTHYNTREAVMRLRTRYQICRLWEEKFTQQPVQYIVKNGYGIYKANPRAIPEVENVIFNGPATIVIWEDGTKTVVKCDENDIFDPEKGLAMAISKRALGNKGNYYDEFKKWTKDLPEPDSAIFTDAYMAYHRLINALHDKKSTKADLGAAMEEAIGYLGHLLDS